MCGEHTLLALLHSSRVFDQVLSMSALHSQSTTQLPSCASAHREQMVLISLIIGRLSRYKAKLQLDQLVRDCYTLTLWPTVTTRFLGVTMSQGNTLVHSFIFEDDVFWKRQVDLLPYNHLYNQLYNHLLNGYKRSQSQPSSRETSGPQGPVQGLFPYHCHPGESLPEDALGWFSFSVQGSPPGDRRRRL